jgi:hypothetical protein
MSSNLDKSDSEQKRKVSILEEPLNNAYDNLGFESDKNRKVSLTKFKVYMCIWF